MSAENWERFCDEYQELAELGLALDLSRMPELNEESLADQIKVALEEMRAIEAGKAVNTDESRMVGHYWLRRPELAPTKELQNSIRETVSAVRSFADRILGGHLLAPSGKAFRSVVLIGIGGSALGPQLLTDCFLDSCKGLEFFFSDNTDPDGMHRIWSSIVQKETLFLVVSKSGGTAETKNGLEFFSRQVEAAGVEFANCAVAVTGVDSQLDKLAKSNNWLARFDIPDWVGGRTSLFSAVGLLPAALLGIPTDELLAGAVAMDERTAPQISFEENPAFRLAASWFVVGDGAGKRSMVMLPYKDRLLLLSRYLQQLVMESIGKAKDREGNLVQQGLTVFGNKGSTDQHAFVQQLRDGKNDFFVNFIEVLTDSTDQGTTSFTLSDGHTLGEYLEGFYLGTREALSENGRPSVSITIESLSPKTLAALIALFERTVGYYAGMLGINAYNQPGVEAGKRTANKTLALKDELLQFLAAQEQPCSVEEIALNLKKEREKERIFKLLKKLSIGPGAPVRASEEIDPRSIKFARS